jgi:hypothetical protein
MTVSKQRSAQTAPGLSLPGLQSRSVGPVKPLKDKKCQLEMVNYGILARALGEQCQSRVTVGPGKLYDGRVLHRDSVAWTGPSAGQGPGLLAEYFKLVPPLSKSDSLE